MIGDPGGKSSSATCSTQATLKRNYERIADQLRRIAGVTLVNNLDWTGA